jgi:hypothetical protein
MRAAVGHTYTSVSASIFQKLSRVLLAAFITTGASLTLFAQTTTVSPATLTFANEAVGSTSAAKIVTIANKGTSAQAVVIVPPDGFTETDTCGGAIAAAGTCKVSVSFAPTLVEKVTGTLSVNDKSSNLLASVSLTGTGIAQSTLTPATLPFGSQTVDVVSAAKTVTFKNNQPKSLTISSIAISGGTAPSDYASSSNCPISPATLGTAQSCTINITLTPSAVGSRTATLTVTHNAPTSPQTVSLTGTGVQPVTLSVGSLGFGAALEGVTTAAKLVTLTNNQKTALTFTNIASTEDFAIASNTCGTSISAAATCKVGVTFSPTATGARTGTLTFTDSAPNSPQTVSLTGTGSAPVTVSPATVTFPTLAVGTTSVASTVTLTNHLATALSISSVVASGDFAVASNTCVPSVGAGLKCTIGVTFTPTLVGARTGTLTISYVAFGSPSLINLKGTGNVTGLKAITVTPNSPSIATGTNEPFVATGLFTSGNTANLTNSVTWSSSALGVASIGATGLANAIAAGQAVIKATSGTISGSTTLTVTGGTTYTIGGSVSGLTGSGLVLQDNGGNNLTVASGATSFTFTTPVASGGAYGVTVLTQPSSPAQTCSVTSGSGTATANVTNIKVTCSTTTYTIGGTVSGLTGSGLVLQDNGGNNLTVASGSTSFTFSSPIPSGGSYSVTVLTQPSSPVQTCSVTSSSGTATANVTNVKVACSATAYTIGGTVSGLTGSGLVLQDNGGNNLTVAAGATSFTFTAPIAAGAAYSVTVLTQPSSPAQMCVVGSGSGTANANVTNVQIACTTTTYTISGTVSGLSGSGLVLRNNGGNSLTVASGATSFIFSASVAAGSSYSVTVLTQPSGPAQTCVVTNGTGTANANVTNVQVTCTAASYTIGGTVSGLTGSGLVLQNNGANNLPVTSGATSFTFTTQVASGGAYKVTVLTQPSNPAQTCTVTNGTGAANGNVTNVQVACTTPTYTIGGSVSGLTGSGLVLQDNGGNNLSLASGVTSFTFSTPVTAGSSYSVSILTQPSNPTQTCTVTNGSGTANANVPNVQVTCATYTATGTVIPTSAHQGSSQTIVITGSNTSFGPTTAVNFGADITVGTVSVNGPTSASVPITIDNVAALGQRNVTITTGSQAVTAPFTLVAGVPAVALINANTIQPTQAESVTITGAFTNWASGTTTANFGPGIAVGGAAAGAFGPVTVTSPTSVTTSLVTSGAAAGFRAVQIQTGSQTLTVNNGLFVGSCTATAPTVLSISPFNAALNVPLNTQIQMQFSAPMNRSTFSLGSTGSATIFFHDAVTNQEVPGTIATDASGTIATITPGELLPAGRSFIVYLSYANFVQDTCGNKLAAQQFSFTTGFGDDLTGPALTGTSPENADTNVALNTPVVLQFNDQLDPITVQTGFSMTNGSTTVSGTFTYSANDQTVTFTPSGPLTASTFYTVSYTSQITDTVGNTLTNPGSFIFVTGTATDTTGPSVTLVDPSNGTLGVGLNVKPHVSFSEPVNELTIPGAFSLSYENGGPNVPATVTVAANRLSATITPSSPLLPNTEYGINLCGYTDIAGNIGGCLSGSTFITGTSADTTNVSVGTIIPSNAQTAVPLNVQIVAVMNDSVDPVSITNSSITVTPSGGSAVAGTVTLASDGVTLTFTPNAALAASKTYTISISGFFDVEGNPVTPFTSTFTTTTTSYTVNSFKLSSTTPANKATGVAVTSTVVFSMSNLIDTASVNSQTVEVMVCLDGVTCSDGVFVAGTYVVSGATVTFTPLTPYPGNAVIGMYVNGLLDEAGNVVYQPNFSTFTTAATVDQTAPTVTISPSNGASNVGLNTRIVLTFAKSINSSTVTAASLAVFSGNTAVDVVDGMSISQDNRTITLNPSGNAWTPGALITVELTNAIQDLSGNALANTTSQFTLTTAVAGSAPSVVAMRPGNGATNVPANTSVTLFISTAMNTSTVNGALYVTDNGVPVSGAVQLFSNAQAIQFTPGNPFSPGDLIQVFLNSTATGSNGIALSSFSGQFTVTGNPANTAAAAQAVNPFPNATAVPLNTVIQVQFSQPLQTGTVTCNGSTGSVTLYQSSTSTYLTPACTVIGAGQIINIAPTSNLVSGSQYQLKISSAVTNTTGAPVSAFTSNFTAGTAVDNAAPTIISEAPINNATNVGTNALVSVNFNKAINPVSVSGSTIQLSGGAVTEVPSSISFTPDYTRVTIIPQAPMPISTLMTLGVNGVTSQAGTAVATKTTTFTTAAQPDFTAPYVLNGSVQNGQTNVPVNSAFSMQFSKPMDIGSFKASNVYVSGGIANSIVPTTVSWSADQSTIFLVPNNALNVGDGYSLCSSGMTDLDGNPQQNFCAAFTAAFTANTTPPTVVNTSPENALSQVPTNAPVQVLFNEPIQPTSIGQITLQTGGNAIAVTSSFTDANQLLTLTPALPLSANTAYTITITGVKDTAGNQMAGTITNTFTTGPTFDLNPPSVLLSDPAPDSLGAGTNVAPHLKFSKRLNPLSVVTSSNQTYNQGSIQLLNTATGLFVPVTVTISSDRTTVTITPISPLTPSTQYELYAGQTSNYYDVAGNSGVVYSSFFTTDTGTDTTPAAVSMINPANAQTAVPVNPQVVAVMSDGIDPTTITNNSITVTPSGGTAVAGTVTLANDGVTLTFVPNAPLAASKLHNVTVGGFNDVQGNPVTTFSSSFTTGSATYGPAAFTLVTTNPASGASGISVTSPVTFTLSHLINPASVNTQTVQVCFNGCGSEYVAGTYTVSGATITFTPLTPYPANTTMGMFVDGVMDEGGNVVSGLSAGSFTTAGTVDSTPPTVTITPANGSSNLGLNTQVVLTFSKSINPTTISLSTVNLFNGDVALNPTVTISQDNRTVVLNSSGTALPAGATITATASHLITDLSGNALTDTSAQFTTMAVQTSALGVLSSRPANGATNVPSNTVITLFTSAPLNTATVPGALYVSQNGILVTGTTSVGGNGQSIVFTPSSSFNAGAPIQVFLNSSAQDINGNSLTNFAETFTIAGALANSAAVAQVVNPFPNATNVPLNTVIQVQFNQLLQSGTVTCNGSSGSVTLYQGSTSTYLTPTCTVVGGGQVINIAPTSNLVSGSTYKVSVNASATNTSGVPVQAFTYTFTAGNAVDTAAPTIVSLAPPNLSANIGTNAGVSLSFNKAINPVSVTGSTVQVSGGSVTSVPSSISFTPDYTRATIIPQAPLPSSTQMAIAISGVTSETGVAVASQTTHFTTMAGPDVTIPAVVNTSVASNQSVGTNAAFAMQFNEPVDPGSLNPAGTKNVYIYDSTSAAYVATTITFSADLTTVMLKPTANLAANQQFQMCSNGMTDLSGNAQQSFCVNFSTGAGIDTAGPAVSQVSPPNGFTGAGINSRIQVLFNEPIDGASIAGVMLKQGNSVIPTTATLFDGDQGIQLLPSVPLTPNTTYTINVTGVLDITGNTQASFPSQSFTTGSGADLVAPTIVSMNPANLTSGVAANTAVQVVFSKAMDPASFDPTNSLALVDSSDNIVPATITFSPDYTTATLQPKSNLVSGGAIYDVFISYFSNLYDLEGNRVTPTITFFLTQ